MVLCSQLGNINEWSIEYAYTPNEIAYSEEIYKLESEIAVENDPEILASKKLQIETLEKLKADEQEVFSRSVDVVADLLKQLFDSVTRK